MPRKVYIGLLFVIIFSFIIPAQIHSYNTEKLTKIVSPKHGAKLSSYPVEIIVKFNRKEKPNTFKAWLNNRNITTKFEQIENVIAWLYVSCSYTTVEWETRPALPGDASDGVIIIERKEEG